MTEHTATKTVNIPCPECGSPNRYATALLEASNGQVQCTSCRHRFTLVRKTKPAAKPAAGKPVTEPNRPAAKTAAAEILPKQNGRDGIASLLGKTSPPPTAERQNARTAENGHGSPEDAIEALLQRNQPAPPPATLPTIDKLLQNVVQPAAGPTQNIHIQAQSLVFNLVSGKENGSSLLRPPIELSDDADGGNRDGDTAATKKQNNEFNWTLASLVALTTLIVQLFYYMLMQS